MRYYDCYIWIVAVALIVFQLALPSSGEFNNRNCISTLNDDMQTWAYSFKIVKIRELEINQNNKDKIKLTQDQKIYYKSWISMHHGHNHYKIY